MSKHELTSLEPELQASGDVQNTPASDTPAPRPVDLDLEEYALIHGEETKKRRRWLMLLLLLLILLAAVTCQFIRYIRQPKPLPYLLPPPVSLKYPPHYLFSIYEIDQPVGVAVSLNGDRIYVAESGGERLMRIFDRDGNALGSSTQPNTAVGERSPVYLTADQSGHVYVSDRMQHAVFVYDRDGRFLDAILAADLTLNQYIAKQTGSLETNEALAYNLFRGLVSYRSTDASDKTLPLPQVEDWSPMGLRFGTNDHLYLTDVTKDRNRIWVLDLGELPIAYSWTSFNPPAISFGASGKENGQFLFPNSAMADSQGRIYVSDGNNGRITVWDKTGSFLFNFGGGAGDGSLNLPRGIFIDSRDRLHIVDAVGQKVHVYDVSGSEPAFLFSFGDFGADDGLFNYPNDIAIDTSGRLYIADRENNRVQVWSY